MTRHFDNASKTVLAKIKASVIEATELSDGFTFRFPSDDDSFAMLSEFIVLERRCCPFLDFKMTVPRGEGDILLELSGADGTKEFIEKNFTG